MIMDASLFQYGATFRRNQLDGILADCENVYERMISTGMHLNNNENKIRDELVRYLMDDDYKITNTATVKNFQVDKEVQEVEHGRVDIRFLQVNPYKGQRVFFTIECKRLDGGTFLNKEYVENGVRRYTKPDKYSTPLGFNGMIGFLVKKQDVNATVATINGYLEASEQLKHLCSDTRVGCYKFESMHVCRAAITLLHLWMDFSSCIE